MKIKWPYAGIPTVVLLLAGCLSPAPPAPTTAAGMQVLQAEPSTLEVTGDGLHAVELLLESSGPGDYMISGSYRCPLRQPLPFGGGEAFWVNGTFDASKGRVYAGRSKGTDTTVSVGTTSVSGRDMVGRVESTLGGLSVGAFRTDLKISGAQEFRVLVWRSCDGMTDLKAKFNGSGNLASAQLSLLPLQLVNHETMQSEFMLSTDAVTHLRNGFLSSESEAERDALVWANGPAPLESPRYIATNNGAEIRNQIVHGKFLHDRLLPGRYEARIPILTARTPYEVQIGLVELEPTIVQVLAPPSPQASGDLASHVAVERAFFPRS